MQCCKGFSCVSDSWIKIIEDPCLLKEILKSVDVRENSPVFCIKMDTKTARGFPRIEEVATVFLLSVIFADVCWAIKSKFHFHYSNCIVIMSSLYVCLSVGL